MITPDRPLYWPELVYELQSLLADTEVYLVGGIVRDVYLRYPVHDLDLATPGDGRPIARRIANAFGGDYYPLDASRGVGRALIMWQDKRWVIDVAQFRGDGLEFDLQDRDFTVNAVAVDLRNLDQVIDPLDGIADMRERLVRLCHADSVANDPVRALRAIRLSLTFRMRIDPVTKATIKRDGVSLKRVSAERIRDEFFKLLGGIKPMAALTLMDSLGMLTLILPEVEALKGVEQSPPHVFDVWRHTLSVVDALDSVLGTIGSQRTDDSAASFALGMVAYSLAAFRAELQNHLDQVWPNERTHRALLVLAALAHDIAKPQTRSIDEDGRIHFYRHEDEGAQIAERWGQALALSREEIDRLRQIVRHHLRPLHLHQSGASRRAVYRFWRDLGEAGIDVCMLSIADQLGKYGPRLDQAYWIEFMQVVQQLLAGYFAQREDLVEIKMLLDGNDVMRELELQPGPMIGTLLAALREAQAMHEVQTREQALGWAKAWLADNA